MLEVMLQTLVGRFGDAVLERISFVEDFIEKGALPRPSWSNGC